MKNLTEEIVENLIEEIGNHCHTHYNGCTMDEYCYDSEVITLLQKVECKDLIYSTIEKVRAEAYEEGKKEGRKEVLEEIEHFCGNE